MSSMSSYCISSHRMSRYRVLFAMLVLGGSADSLRAADIVGIVVDRTGSRHQVRDLEIRGSTTLEYYVSGRRRQMQMARIERLHIGGTPQDQEAPVTVTMRTGLVEKGTMIINAGSSLSDDAGSASHVSDRLTGKTNLGPLFLPLTDVQEVLFQHSKDAPLVPDMVSGSIVDERGRRFVVSDIRYRGDDAFRFKQGRKKKRVALRHVSRLEFGDSPGGELRPVTITYQTGRVVQGQVDASTVRLSGEVDHVYRTRTDSAFTGVRSEGGMFGIGLKRVKLVLVKAPAEETDEATETSEGQTQESQTQQD